MAALLLLQVGLAGLSTDSLWQISVFCTAPASSPWSLVFGLVHALLLGLLIFGLFSLHFVRLRLPYIALVTAALIALPIQALFVTRGTLWCDIL